MSLEQIETIETLAGDYMDYYGYEKMTNAKAKITEKTIAIAKEQSELKKQQAWMEMKVNAPHDYQLRKFRATYLNMLKERLLQDQTRSLEPV
jgi:hypothetical protein